jgi:hypothetical protein
MWSSSEPSSDEGLVNIGGPVPARTGPLFLLVAEVQEVQAEKCFRGENRAGPSPTPGFA